MVFDGVCNFCSGYVRAVTMMDRTGVIHFTAMQSAYGADLCRRYGIDPTDPSTFLFIDDGKVWTASDAMIAMFKRLPAPWRWLSVLEVAPRPWRDAVYRWTARNRYSLLGKRRTCIIPPQNIRDRFIDEPPVTM